jgi:hypothetical protein
LKYEEHKITLDLGYFVNAVPPKYRYISEDFINFDFYRTAHIYDDESPGYRPDEFPWTGLRGFKFLFCAYALVMMLATSLGVRRRVDWTNKSLFLVLSTADYQVHQTGQIARARPQHSVIVTRSRYVPSLRDKGLDEVPMLTFSQLLGHADLGSLVGAVRAFRRWRRGREQDGHDIERGHADYMFVLFCLSSVFESLRDDLDSVHMSAIRSYVFRAIPTEKIFLYQHGLVWDAPDRLSQVGIRCNHVLWGEVFDMRDDAGMGWVLTGNPWHERLVERGAHRADTDTEDTRCLFFSDLFTYMRMDQDDLVERYLDALQRFDAADGCEMQVKLHVGREHVEDVPRPWLREHVVSGSNETVIPQADVTISNHSSAYFESLVAGVPTILIDEADRASDLIPEAIRELEGVRILDGLDHLSPDVARQHADVDVDVAELREAGIVGEADIVDRVWARVDTVG